MNARRTHLLAILLRQDPSFEWTRDFLGHYSKWGMILPQGTPETFMHTTTLQRVDTRCIRPRQIELHTPAQAIAEATRLAELARAGKLRTMGNWSAGQIFAHLAWWIEAIDENKGPKPPWFMKLIGPMIKKKILHGPLMTGFRIPRSATGTFGDEPCELEEGFARFCQAMQRLDRAAPPLPDRHPLFGSMSGKDWLSLHLRHAELHLGFLEEA